MEHAARAAVFAEDLGAAVLKRNGQVLFPQAEPVADLNGDDNEIGVLERLLLPLVEDPVGDVENEGEVGAQAAGGYMVQRFHGLYIQPPAVALVSGGGHREAVGDDHSAGFQGGDYDVGGVLGPRGLVEKNLGQGIYAVGGVEEYLPDGLGDARAAGLAGQQGLETVLPEPGVQQFHLRGFARAVRAFEHDKEAFLHSYMISQKLNCNKSKILDISVCVC